MVFATADQPEPVVILFREDFLQIAALLSLGRSYEFTERLGDFSDETRRQANKLPKP
jgi:hypothetical protein